MKHNLAIHSRYVSRIRRRYANELALLPQGEISTLGLNACLSALSALGHELGVGLRITRALCLERLAVLDCDEGAPLSTITQGITTLADWALDLAVQSGIDQLDALHGAALRSDGQRAAFWVVGMGKLGARELNVSSDIDLIYVYDEDGDTAGLPDGRGRMRNHEYFSRLARRINTLLAEVTEHGFVFRIDLALRPHGNSGPAVCSLESLEGYLQSVGREWERFAWLKSRVVAPQSAKSRATALRPIVLPFVFRRYLDYGVFESLRDLHQQIRSASSQRASGRPERANDVKISRGGIRELEFTVQLLQVVRGGQYPELRTRPTLDAMERLVRAGLIEAGAAQCLHDAYVFLRKVEHRIQYLDDQQTHVLPTVPSDLLWIANSMGFEDAAGFEQALAAHRQCVSSEFDKLLGQADSAERSENTATSAQAPQQSDAQANSSLAFSVQTWLDNCAVQNLRDDVRVKVVRIAKRTLQWLEDGSLSSEQSSSDGLANIETLRETALLRFLDWMEPLLRRDNYLSLLIERPLVHRRLLRLLGLARWPARYLLKHPGVIDELAGEAVLQERFNAQVFDVELQRRADALARTGQNDDEALMGLLRRAQQAEAFRILVRDVEAQITVEQVADELSALADAVLGIAVRWVWGRLKQAHRPDPQLAIVAYGKLGGKELGYGGDLDIVCLFEEDDAAGADVQAIYSAFVRKLITWLSTKTSDGDLYDIDTALRPNGNSGLLVTTLAAFAEYQLQRGSNAAWTWEHQAMTRARCVLGPATMRARFDEIRMGVLRSEREGPTLKNEILSMRERVRAAHPTSSNAQQALFDLKHSPGGMVDAEFALQYLILRHSCQFPTLCDNLGTIALLARCDALGLLPPGVGQAAGNAYRELRRAQHKARLDEQSTEAPLDTLKEQQLAILKLWSSVFSESSILTPTHL